MNIRCALFCSFLNPASRRIKTLLQNAKSFSTMTFHHFTSFCLLSAALVAAAPASTCTSSSTSALAPTSTTLPRPNQSSPSNNWAVCARIVNVRKTPVADISRAVFITMPAISCGLPSTSWSRHAAQAFPTTTLSLTVYQVGLALTETLPAPALFFRQVRML